MTTLQHEHTASSLHIYALSIIQQKQNMNDIDFSKSDYPKEFNFQILRFSSEMITSQFALLTGY